MRSPSRLALSLLALAPLAGAQQLGRPEAIPSILGDPLGLDGGTLQNLVLPLGGWAPFEVRVELDGVTRTLSLQPHDLRAPGFEVIEVTAAGRRVLEAPLPNTYRGTVEGLPEAIVAANLYEGQLSALVLIGEDVWAVQPATEGLAWLPRSAHVVYRQDHLRSSGASCEVLEPTEKRVHEHVTADPDREDSSAPLVAEIAAELEPRFRNLWGGPAGAINQATSILNGVDAIYQRDVNVQFVITRLVLRDKGYNTNTTTVLSRMQNTWNSRAGEIQRDVAHLFMGATGSGVIGVAYLSTICTSSAYSVSWHTSSLTTRTAVTAHELGHAFSAGHCDGSSTCLIMCSFIGGCSGGLTSFAPVSINRISNYAASRPCLD